MDEVQHDRGRNPGKARRALRHLLSSRNEAERAFPPATLAAIAEAITPASRPIAARSAWWSKNPCPCRPCGKA
jgi:hypothetical protein